MGDRCDVPAQTSSLRMYYMFLQRVVDYIRSYFSLKEYKARDK